MEGGDVVYLQSQPWTVDRTMRPVRSAPSKHAVNLHATSFTIDDDKNYEFYISVAN